LTCKFHLVRASGEGVFKDAEIVSPPVRQFQKAQDFLEKTCRFWYNYGVGKQVKSTTNPKEKR
jgi:hypothetical protein